MRCLCSQKYASLVISVKFIDVDNEVGCSKAASDMKLFIANRSLICRLVQLKSAPRILKVILGSSKLAVVLSNPTNNPWPSISNCKWPSCLPSLSFLLAVNSWSTTSLIAPRFFHDILPTFGCLLSYYYNLRNSPSTFQQTYAKQVLVSFIIGADRICLSPA